MAMSYADVLRKGIESEKTVLAISKQNPPAKVNLHTKSVIPKPPSKPHRENSFGEVFDSDVDSDILYEGISDDSSEDDILCDDDICDLFGQE